MAPNPPTPPPRRSDSPVATFLSEQPFNQALVDGARELGIKVTEHQLQLFSHNYSLLLARRGHRLTAITDPVSAAIKHFLDSLTALLIRDIEPEERVADIGSGAGFPGLVLAVARPQASYLLVEANQRRAAFLEQCAAALGLPHVAVIAERAETLARAASIPPLQTWRGGQGVRQVMSTRYRETYDLVVARALAPLPVLLEYCLPLVRVGGDCLALKGPGGESELGRSGRALDLLGGRIEATRKLSLASGMGERLLVLVRKAAPTPDRYPRRPGTPAKRPLL
jgi:16S rRNA (guanine527-N7)-methyltransferase